MNEIYSYLLEIPEIKKNIYNEKFFQAVTTAIKNYSFEKSQDFRVYPWVREIYKNLV